MRRGVGRGYLSAVVRSMNKTRKELLRNMPDMITRDEVIELVAAPPDVWRYFRIGCRAVAGLLMMFMLWVLVAVFTDPITPWIVCGTVAAWLAPKYFKEK